MTDKQFKELIGKKVFIKDKFEIFTEVVKEEFSRSRVDCSITLADLLSLIGVTENVESHFDNSISIKENVSKYYSKEK